jgi:TPR repeat protein
MNKLLVFCACLGLSIFSVIRAAETQKPLPVDFLTDRPMVQLFKAYAEFKMANYDLAKRMLKAVGGAARPEALFNLGVMEEDGLGGPADREAALRYYTAAASANNRAAQYRLGQLYLYGDANHPPDLALAKNWLQKAANDGDKDAAQLLGSIKSSNSESPLEPFFAARRAEALGDYSVAAEGYRALAKEGHTRAITRLAWLHEAGQLGDVDMARAAELFEQAASLGDAEAQYALGVIYTTAVGRDYDAVLARKWLTLAAEQGHESAHLALKSLP